MCLIAKVIRISHAKFQMQNAIDLQLYKIYKSLIFLGHSVVNISRYQ